METKIIKKFRSANRKNGNLEETNIQRQKTLFSLQRMLTKELLIGLNLRLRYVIHQLRMCLLQLKKYQHVM